MIPRRAGVVLVLALGLTASCALPPPPAAPAAGASAVAEDAPPAPCMTEYRALLDLADLARRYGPSAGLFIDPLGDLFDELDDCLEAAGGRDGLARAEVIAIGARAQLRAPRRAVGSRLKSPFSSEASFSSR